jgi:acetylglutamate kinase
MESRKVLIKYGGNAMVSDELKLAIAQKIKQLKEHNIQVVLVHGGGPFINKALESSGIVTEFFDGHRHTSLEALTCIERTLKGEVNSSLVNLLNKQGLRAVGLSGKDGKMVRAKKRWHIQKNKGGNESRIDLGQVGDVEQVDVSLLSLLLEGGFTPVITCIASDAEGNDYNINGDVFAGKIASALRVDEYVVLTDVDGLFLKFPDPASIVRELPLSTLAEYYGTVIQGGMIPKISSCEAALKEGVEKVIIMNGTKPEQITDYLLHQKKTGTTLIK